MRPTSEQAQDWALLKLANEKGKFALSLGGVTPEVFDAFERGCEFGWFMMVDIAPLQQAGGVVCRVFWLTDVGRKYRKSLKEIFSGRE